MSKYSTYFCYILHLSILCYASFDLAHCTSRSNHDGDIRALTPKLKLDSNVRSLIVSARSVDDKRQVTTVDSNRKRNSDWFISLFSGGLAGSVSSTLTCPIEVIKTQLQTGSLGTSNPVSIAKHIAKTEGIKGFFRGLTPTLVGIIPNRAAYFWAYSNVKKKLIGHFGDGTITHLIAGFSAGMVGNTITNPIWMVKTRMQVLANTASGQVSYTSYSHAIKHIFRNEGIGGFYKGLSASYWGCSEGCIQFVLYEKLKKILRENHRNHYESRGLPVPDILPSYQLFLSAAISKFVATITTYPHEVVRTRLREQAKYGVFKYTGMWQSLVLISKEEGRRGLYAGMGTHVARVVPNTAIMFLSYELINAWLEKKNKREYSSERHP